MYRVKIHETENPQEVKMSARISLRGMLRLIRIDTLRRVHNVGFLVIRLFFIFTNAFTPPYEHIVTIPRAWRETVVTKNLF